MKLLNKIANILNDITEDQIFICEAGDMWIIADSHYIRGWDSDCIIQYDYQYQKVIKNKIGRYKTEYCWLSRHNPLTKLIKGDTLIIT